MTTRCAAAATANNPICWYAGPAFGPTNTTAPPSNASGGATAASGHLPSINALPVATSQVTTTGRAIVSGLGSIGIDAVISRAPELAYASASAAANGPPPGVRACRAAPSPTSAAHSPANEPSTGITDGPPSHRSNRLSTTAANAAPANTSGTCQPM